jgi:ribosomal protein S18 acetylase RimI-like enzyme
MGIHTPENVKLLLSPRQSRGITCFIYMKIRTANPLDEPAIVAMAVAFRNHLQRDTPTDEQFQASIRTLLASPDAEFFVTHEVQEQALGYVLQRYRHSMWTNGLEATIEDLFVDPAFRKQGAGKALIEFALAGAASAGCTSVCLGTNEFNLASIRIYTSLGFNAISKRWNGRQIFFRKSIS